MLTEEVHYFFPHEPQVIYVVFNQFSFEGWKLQWSMSRWGSGVPGSLERRFIVQLDRCNSTALN